MTKTIKLTPLIIGALIMCGLAAYMYIPKEQANSDRMTSATPVVVHTVGEAEFTVVIEALGTAKANEAVYITAQTTDVVQSIGFEDGDIVEQGKVILTLNDREELARLNELDVNLAEAKRQLKRIINLAKESVASQQLLDEQQAKVKAIKAQREVASAQLAELQVKAPFGGKLGIRQVSLGALVRPGDTITTLDDLSVVKVDFSIAESHLPTVAIGQQVTATSIAYPDKTFVGKISGINSRIDPVTRAVQVRAVIDNPDLELRPGMLMQILLKKQTLQTLVIPEAAMIPIEDKQFVFVVSDGKAQKREVQVGRRKPGVVQLLEGLKPGEQVVIEGTLRLNDGSAVNVQSERSLNQDKG